jgi:hypothetical protein
VAKQTPSALGLQSPGVPVPLDPPLPPLDPPLPLPALPPLPLPALPPPPPPAHDVVIAENARAPVRAKAVTVKLTRTLKNFRAFMSPSRLNFSQSTTGRGRMGIFE